MASLILTAAGQAIGSALGSSMCSASRCRARRSAARSAHSSARRSTPRSRPGTRTKGPRLTDIAIQSSTEGAAIPRVFGRVRCRRPAHLGDAVQGDRDECVERRQGHRRPEGHGDGTMPTRSPSPWACATASPRASGGCGPTAPDRSLAIHDAVLFRQRNANRRSADRGDRRCGQHAALSRPLLHGVRGHGAGGIRQPHPAIAIRGHPRDQRLRSRGAGERAHRRRDHPWRGRVRLRHR